LGGKVWFFASADLVWFFAGVRDLLSGLLASPLCGAAPTFLCGGKEK
jgi:hypothetical protein